MYTFSSCVFSAVGFRLVEVECLRQRPGELYRTTSARTGAMAAFSPDFTSPTSMQLTSRLQVQQRSHWTARCSQGAWLLRSQNPKPSIFPSLAYRASHFPIGGRNHRLLWS